jgi:hypothetical protein
MEETPSRPIRTALRRPERWVPRKPWPYIVIIVCIACLLASINLPYGIAEDSDGYRVLRGAAGWAAKGYQKSRTWGFPSYELVIYPIVHYLGLFYAKLYAMLCYALAALFFFLTLLELTADAWRAFLGALCFAVLPVSIIGGNTLLETSQGILFAILGLYFYLRFHRSPNALHLGVLAVCLGIATSTRLDYVFLSASVALTVLWFDRPTFKHVMLGVLAWAAFALAPFGLYKALSFSANVILPDPFWRKMSRVVLGYLALLGLPASAVVGFWLLRSIARSPNVIKRIIKDNILFMFIVSLILYTVRFVLLPDELEYVYILIPLLIALTAKAGFKSGSLALLVVAVALPNVIQLHLFERSRDADLVFSPGISPGAIAQDRSARLRNEYLNGELLGLMPMVAQSYGYKRFATSPSTEPGTLVIIPEEDLRYYRPDRWGGQYYRAFNQVQVISYPLSSSRGWRQFIQFTSWHKLTLADFQKVKMP